MEEQTPGRLILLAVIAVLGLLITVIVNWDKIAGNLTRLKRSIWKSEKDKQDKTLSHLKAYLIHYAYDFDNGEGRDWFMTPDVLVDIENETINEWVSDNFDAAVNSLVVEGYLERLEKGLSPGYKLTAEGMNHYTTDVKENIEEIMSKLEASIIK